MTTVFAFPRNWSVEILRTPPLIAPARQFTYPQQIAGERRRPRPRRAAGDGPPGGGGGTFLATCALGFTDPTMPSGVFACPDAFQMCAVAGGYAYVIDTARPEHSTHIQLKPVVEVRPLVAQGLILVRRLPFDDGVGPQRACLGVGPAQLGGSSHQQYRRRHAAWHWVESSDRSGDSVLSRSAHRTASRRRFCSSAGKPKKLSAASPCFNKRLCSSPP